MTRWISPFAFVIATLLQGWDGGRLGRWGRGTRLWGGDADNLVTRALAQRESVYPPSADMLEHRPECLPLTSRPQIGVSRVPGHVVSTTRRAVAVQRPNSRCAVRSSNRARRG